MLKVKGKFYLVENVASATPHYWCEEGAGFVTNPHDATFYDTGEQAQAAKVRAENYTDAEVIVNRALRDIPNPGTRVQ